MEAQPIRTSAGMEWGGHTSGSETGLGRSEIRVATYFAHQQCVAGRGCQNGEGALSFHTSCRTDHVG